MTAFVLFFGIGFSTVPETQAKASNDFSQPFGLLVHNKNKETTLTRVKALEVLMKYFAEVPYEKTQSAEIGFKDINRQARAFHYLEKACGLGLISCDEAKFFPYEPVTQAGFLNWFFRLKYFETPHALSLKYPYLASEAARSWLEARRLNLLVDTEMTYRVVQELLYRNRTVESNYDLPYIEGLTFDEEDVNANNYNNIQEIDMILSQLNQVLISFKTNEVLSEGEEVYLKTIGKNYNAFLDLKTSLLETPYLIRQYPDMDPQVRDAIREHNLQNILYRHSYFYGDNAGYRQHNLKTGVVKFNGKVFMDDEVIDYWDMISDNNLSEFKYGWVIANGIEQWQFGGGICGSSTMIFIPAWKAGLEIVERRNHTIYYPDLYPREDIGLDATVYRPAPNLKIRNNTGSPIVFNVIDDTETETLTVEIIGNKPYKTIDYEGPNFVGPRHVKWVRHIEDFSGKIVSEALESRYRIIH